MFGLRALIWLGLGVAAGLTLGNLRAGEACRGEGGRWDGEARVCRGLP